MGVDPKDVQWGWTPIAKTVANTARPHVTAAKQVAHLNFSP